MTSYSKGEVLKNNSGEKENDMNKLIETWSSIRLKLKSLEKKEKEIKLYIKDIMTKETANVMETDKFTVIRKQIKRKSISRKDVPLDIWEKYSKESEYDMFYLKEILKNEEE